MTSLTIPRRFVGPPGAAHGGYLGGSLAKLLPEHPGVEVRLRAPTPVGRALEVDRADPSGLRLLDGDRVLVECRPADLELEIPPLIGFDEAERAGGMDAWRSMLEELPEDVRGFFDELDEGDRCFACLPRSDGLNLFVGAAEGRDVVADTVAFPPDLVQDGFAPGEMVWAAVDCPSMWATRLLADVDERRELAGRTVVTGGLAVRIHRLPRSDERLFVQAWRLGREGRKLFGAGVLATDEGEVLAEARQTAIVV